MIGLAFTLIPLLHLLQGGEAVSKPSLNPQQIFERSAKAHLGEKTEIKVEDFKLDFGFITRDEKNIEFRANHLFKTPNLVKTTLDDTDYGNRTDTGFDGKIYWFKDKERGVVELSGREHRKDISEIDERISLSKILARTFSLKRFLQDLKEPKRLPDEKTPQGERLVVQAKAVDFVLVKDSGIHPEVDVILYFDPESFLLREVFATPPPRTGSGSPSTDTSERSEKIVLSKHEKIKDILLPTQVEIYAGKKRDKAIFEITIVHFDFNMGLKDEDFQAPKAPPK